MKCPACESSLLRVEYEGVNIETCVECDGEWVEGDRLRSIESRREMDVTQTSTAGTAARSDQPEIRRTCPRCTVPMQKYRYGKDKSIIVDQCSKCKGIWLDDGELEAIQQAYERWEDFVEAEETRGDAPHPRPVPSKQAIAANFARSMTRTSMVALISKWILSLAILFGPAIAIGFTAPEMLGLAFWAVYTGVWIIVLVIAKYVEFYPDTDDLGWFGGMMDDPFSWSDDWNRTLLWWKMIFKIPKFVVSTFDETFEAAKR